LLQTEEEQIEEKNQRIETKSKQVHLRGNLRFARLPGIAAPADDFPNRESIDIVLVVLFLFKVNRH
jgi:hypothetical protein